MKFTPLYDDLEKIHACNVKYSIGALLMNLSATWGWIDGDTMLAALVQSCQDGHLVQGGK